MVVHPGGEHAGVEETSASRGSHDRTKALKVVPPAPPGASSFLLSLECWEDLWRALGATSSGTKGEVFELLVQEYLQLDARYDFKNVWNTHGQIPPAVLKKLNLFSRDVTGIDLVAETRGGKYWAIQCKYHQ